MTRTKLLSILQEETDGFKEQSRLRDDVLDAMEEAYIKGKNEQLTIPVVVRRSKQLVCDMCGSYKLEECTKDEYACEDCGHFPITN
jgi:hypothetical protein